MRRSLRLRLLLGATLWISAALALAGVVILSLLRDFVERTFDERLNANLVAVMTAVTVDDQGNVTAGGAVTEPVFNQPLSGWYWQVANGQSVVLRSRSLWDAGFGEEVGSVGTRRTIDDVAGPNGEWLRASTRDFTAPGGTGVFRVLVAGPASEIEDALQAIYRPLTASLLVLGLGLAGAVVLQITIGLRPLGAVRTSLAAVRRGDLQRLPDPGHAEIAPLVHELNQLIDRNHAVVERSRRHVANLAHGLKTPLAVLTNNAALRGSHDGAGDDEQLRTMERLIKHHLRRARSAAASEVIGRSTPVMPVVDDICFAMRRVHRGKLLDVTKLAADDVVFAGEREDLEEMVGNLVDNACKWALRLVTIQVGRAAETFWIVIEDDGPGLGAENHAAAFIAGARLDETAPGSGFGLAIVHELSELYGGGISLSQAEAGGLRATLSLPSRG